MLRAMIERYKNIQEKGIVPTNEEDEQEKRKKRDREKVQY